MLLYCMKCNLMLNVPHGNKNGAFLLKFCRVLKVEAKYTSSCNLLKDYSCIWLLASLFIKLVDAKLAVHYMIRFMKALGIYQRQSTVAWIWNLIKWASPTPVLLNQSAMLLLFLFIFFSFILVFSYFFHQFYTTAEKLIDSLL